VLEEIRSELSNRIEEKHAILEASRLPSVSSITFQVKQLLINLIGNALKYTRPGIAPHIRITGEIVSAHEVPAGATPKFKEYIKVSVADNGIGFEEKYTSKIFELFQRLHSKDRYSGTGIGLALCKKIVESLHGYITAESKPGKGSVFTFFIPRNNM
jgi:signal transduction histidine kinase